ncbi:MAG: alanine/ornithine racemase family PLP-dependent enzyme [Pleomorphochaeta sp.]
MEYPRLDIQLKTIKENVSFVKNLCNTHGIDVTGVTKVFSASPEIVQAYIDGGLDTIGDARIENLKRVKDFKIKKWLIRVPPISQIKDVVMYSDVSLNSELETIYELNKEAKKQNKVHEIILMVDLGDLREGYIKKDELIKVANKVKTFSNVKLYGIGTNLSCYSFVIPSEENMIALDDFASVINVNNIVISGGNSSSINIMRDGKIPNSINNLRLGESLLFGKERCTYTYIKGTSSNAFILNAEIVELKYKPSISWGEVGVDSYGKKPQERIDEGIIKRCLLAIGKQDCDIETMKPVDKNLKILGASSDYLIVQIKTDDKKYKVGDIIQFELGYFSLMRAMTSKYVIKNYI